VQGKEIHYEKERKISVDSERKKETDRHREKEKDLEQDTEKEKENETERQRKRKRISINTAVKQALSESASVSTPRATSAFTAGILPTKDTNRDVREL